MSPKEINLTSSEENIKKVQYLHEGQHIWNSLPVTERSVRIKKLRKVVAKRAQEIARAVSKECHRPITEALCQEVLPVLEMSKYCENQFPKWLKDEKIRYLRPGFWRKQNIFVKQAIGPIGVITPSNFPFTLGMMSLIYLLMAGNTVMLKPSEYSQTVAQLIEDLLKEVDLLPDFANLLSGGNEIGKWLVKQPEIKKIIFFGRQANGLSILKECSQNFKPCVLELSGGSTAIVGKDANLNLATSGITWSGFYANGQSCIGTDRVLIEKEIAPEFIALLLKKISNFQSEVFNDQIHFGIMNDSEISQLKQIIEMAKKEGCKVLCGGNHIQRSQKRFAFEYTVLSAPDTHSNVFKEEFFGPMIVICPVEDLNESVTEINSVYPSLGVSIWKKNRRETINIAKNIHASMIWVNDTSFGLPCLPWFGTGATGWGRLFSRHSLHEILEEKWISFHPARFTRKRIWWNPYSMLKEKVFSFGANKIFSK